MYLKFRNDIRKYEMIAPEDHILVGVSGGADSVCLLYLLCTLKKELEIEVSALHVNHGLRKETAIRDERFVIELCEKLGVRLTICHEDVATFAKIHKQSTEEAGRNVRRKCLINEAKKIGATKIALAHHKNDDVETILMNLCRGTGIRGAIGILPVDGMWIRPLLKMERFEIERFLKSIDIEYCDDETNFEDEYTRNRMRHHVIPYLTDQINEQSVSHIQKFAKQLMEMEEFLEDEVKKYDGYLFKTSTGIRIDLSSYQMIPKALRKVLLKKVLEEVGGERKDLSSVHVESLERLWDSQVGKKIDLPYGVVAKRIYEGIIVEKEMKLHTEKRLEKECQEYFSTTIKELENGETFPESDYTKWFDYDIIKSTLEFRHRKPGDYIVIDKNGRTQKLKQYFINSKIPQQLRDEIWIVAEGAEVLWVVGYRQSQKYQVGSQTKRVLVIDFKKE